MYPNLNVFYENSFSKETFNETSLLPKAESKKSTLSFKKLNIDTSNDYQSNT